MGLKKSIELRKKIKNIQRFKEILSIFAHNGFDELIVKAGLHTIIPEFVLPASKQEKLSELKGEDWSHGFAFRLRKSFEDLGPAFIKLGQLLATREDLFDAYFISEMKNLQDKVKGISFVEATKLIGNELGQDYKSVFLEINPSPVGTASISVVYRAVLLNGENVVIKIRRPGIQKNINADLNILLFIVRQLESLNENLKYLGLSRSISELGRSLIAELNFEVEMNNCIKMFNYVEKYDVDGVIKIPKVYKNLSTKALLVMEYIDGKSFNNCINDDSSVLVIKEKVDEVLSILVRVMFIDGFFHCDLHAGNLFLQADKSIAVIDFGLCGTLTDSSSISLLSIVQSIYHGHFENLINELLDVVQYDDMPDVQALTLDVRDALNPLLV